MCSNFSHCKDESELRSWISQSHPSLPFMNDSINRYGRVAKASLSSLGCPWGHSSQCSSRPTSPPIIRLKRCVPLKMFCSASGVSCHADEIYEPVSLSRFPPLKCFRLVPFLSKNVFLFGREHTNMITLFPFSKWRQKQCFFPAVFITMCTFRSESIWKFFCQGLTEDVGVLVSRGPGVLENPSWLSSTSQSEANDPGPFRLLRPCFRDDFACHLVSCPSIPCPTCHLQRA